MLDIKFASNSLLYGESYFWMVLSALAPMHLAPNFRTTRTEHAVKLLPQAALVMEWHTRVSESRAIKSLMAQSFLLFQLLYLIIYVVIGAAIEDEILTYLSIPKSQTLTYKILVQTPTLFRSGLLVISLINMQDLDYKLWSLYDKCDAFSVNSKYQARVASWCLVSVAPDALANVFETLFIVHFIRSTGHHNDADSWWVRYVSTWVMYIVLSGLINILVRYKPVLNLTYTATCVGKHLEFIYSQIVATATAPSASRSGAIVSKEIPIWVLREQAVGGEASHLCAIRNLYQLEQHLTRVQLFISDLDRESPASILSLTVINTTTFFYSIFYTSYHSDSVTILLALIYCAARALPLVVMFVAGSRLERTCRKINDKLERIYFEGHSHRLIYKQKASSHLSLARAFGALGDIRLTCNGLMDVNVRTLRKCAIYVGTVILIVAQYDLLLDSSNSRRRPNKAAATG